MPDLLFVYGSLRSEFANPHVRFLREKAESLGRARVRGSIFHLGSYPGYQPEPDGIVHGELWRLRDAKATLKALDNYEGKDYSRIVVEAEIDAKPAGESAWIYRYDGIVSADSRIFSGDFLKP